MVKVKEVDHPLHLPPPYPASLSRKTEERLQRADALFGHAHV